MASARELNDVTGAIIGAAIGIHKEIGPGLFESVYGLLLTDVLRDTGFAVEVQKWIPVELRGRKFKKGFRADLIVEDTVIVEVKSTALIAPVVPKQVITYLRLAHKPLGLILNFGSESLGIRRIINGFQSSPSAKS